MAVSNEITLKIQDDHILLSRMKYNCLFRFHKNSKMAAYDCPNEITLVSFSSKIQDCRHDVTIDDLGRFQCQLVK